MSRIVISPRFAIWFVNLVLLSVLTIVWYVFIFNISISFLFFLIPFNFFIIPYLLYYLNCKVVFEDNNLILLKSFPFNSFISCFDLDLYAGFLKKESIKISQIDEIYFKIEELPNLGGCTGSYYFEMNYYYRKDFSSLHILMKNEKTFDFDIDFLSTRRLKLFFSIIQEKNPKIIFSEGCLPFISNTIAVKSDKIAKKKAL